MKIRLLHYTTSILLLIFAGIADTEAQTIFGFHYNLRTNDSIVYKNGIFTRKKEIHPSCKAYLGFGRPRMKAELKYDTDGVIIVDFWPFEPGAKYTAAGYVNTSDVADSFRLYVRKGNRLNDPNWYRVFRYSLTEIGAISIPIKIRFGYGRTTNDISTDINAGVYLSRKWGRKLFYYEKDNIKDGQSIQAAIFLGPTVVDINRENVKDTTRFDVFSFGKSSKEFALASGLGAMYSFRKLNLGAFAGVDVPFGKTGQNWVHANRLWLGIAVGYELNVFNTK